MPLCRPTNNWNFRLKKQISYRIFIRQSPACISNTTLENIYVHFKLNLENHFIRVHELIVIIHILIKQFYSAWFLPANLSLWLIHIHPPLKNFLMSKDSLVELRKWTSSWGLECTGVKSSAAHQYVQKSKVLSNGWNKITLTGAC